MNEKIWNWAPVAVAVVLAVLWVRPCRRLPPDDEAKARSIIVPLNARDPSALVMGPGGLTEYYAPTVKPR